MVKNAGGSKVLMVLEHLNDIPNFDYPEGYYWQWYSAGDEVNWLKIQNDSEPFIKMNSDLYLNEFQKMNDDLKDRQGFLKNDKNEFIGTGTAWFDQYQFKKVGRIHWIALIPSEQGKGLSKLIVQETLIKLKQLEYTSAYLHTSSSRVAAIKTYLAFGFQPKFDVEEYQIGWDEYLKNVR